MKYENIHWIIKREKHSLNYLYYINSYISKIGKCPIFNQLWAKSLQNEIVLKNITSSLIFVELTISVITIYLFTLTFNHHFVPVIVSIYITTKKFEETKLYT